jgi:hypothetical protein
MGEDRLATLTPVIVRWYDAKVSDSPDDCPIMESIGWAKEYKNRIVLHHILRPDNCHEKRLMTIIPAGCILSIHRLK